MLRTINVSEKTYGRLLNLKNQIVQFSIKDKKFINPDFDSVVTELLDHYPKGCEEETFDEVQRT